MAPPERAAFIPMQTHTKADCYAEAMTVPLRRETVTTAINLSVISERLFIEDEGDGKRRVQILVDTTPVDFESKWFSEYHRVMKEANFTEIESEDLMEEFLVKLQRESAMKMLKTMII